MIFGGLQSMLASSEYSSISKLNVKTIISICNIFCLDGMANSSNGTNIASAQYYTIIVQFERGIIKILSLKSDKSGKNIKSRRTKHMCKKYKNFKSKKND